MLTALQGMNINGINEFPIKCKAWSTSKLNIVENLLLNTYDSATLGVYQIKQISQCPKRGCELPCCCLLLHIHCHPVRKPDSIWRTKIALDGGQEESTSPNLRHCLADCIVVQPRHGLKKPRV